MTEFARREPFCTKGDPFEVYVAEDGYSILTMTITVTDDSTVSDAAARAPISKTEFDRDSENGFRAVTPACATGQQR